MWLWVTICILILVFSTLCSLLSSKFQGKKWKWIRVCAVIAALMILARNVYQEIDAYQSRIFAHVSSDGTILSQHNFPWRIREYPTSKGKAAYILSKRTDGAELLVIPDRPVPEPNVYGCVSGVFIEFNCPADELSGFRIEIKD